MYTLASSTPAIFDSLKQYKVPEYFLTVFRAALLLTLDGVSVQADKANPPRIVIERDSDGYFFQVEYLFRSGKHSVCYTFQVTVKPGAATLSQRSLHYLPSLGTKAPDPIVSIGFTAARNGLVYYQHGVEGDFTEATTHIKSAFGT